MMQRTIANNECINDSWQIKVIDVLFPLITFKLQTQLTLFLADRSVYKQINFNIVAFKPKD